MLWRCHVAVPHGHVAVPCGHYVISTRWYHVIATTLSHCYHVVSKRFHLLGGGVGSPMWLSLISTYHANPQKNKSHCLYHLHTMINLVILFCHWNIFLFFFHCSEVLFPSLEVWKLNSCPPPVKTSTTIYPFKSQLCVHHMIKVYSQLALLTFHSSLVSH